MAERDLSKAGQALSREDLRRQKLRRDDFLARPRKPITVVLDGIRQNYNVGAVFRLCDAFLVERLIIAAPAVELRKRKLAQAAQGSQHWVPWDRVDSAAAAVAAAKSAGAWVVAVEQTSAGVPPEAVAAAFPAWVVLGSEKTGVSREIIDIADVAVTIPMLGMANSINVAAAAAIVLYRIARSVEGRAETAPLTSGPSLDASVSDASNRHTEDH
jgi:tRNA G18 (ribose-2'-O)-methylase SpoU